MRKINFSQLYFVVLIIKIKVENISINFLKFMEKRLAWRIHHFSILIAYLTHNLFE